jgi:rhodanese-related sulfurtransferase
MATDNKVYKLISPAEAKEKIDAAATAAAAAAAPPAAEGAPATPAAPAAPGVAVVDTRPPADWAGGHIPGAQNLPLVSIRGRAREIPEGSAVIFVCQTGDRAPQAAETLSTLGFSEIYVLDGGVDAWVKAGNSLETIN